MLSKPIMPKAACLLFFLLCQIASSSICLANNRRDVTIPVAFEENKGQADKSIYFIARDHHGSIFLTQDGPILGGDNISSARGIHLHFINPANAKPIGELPTGGFANYYLSQDPAKWLTHLPMYSQVRYASIYNGVDAIFHAHGDQLEYDLEISPGADPKPVRFSVDGANRTFITAEGVLTIVSGEKTWSLLPPYAYQQIGDRRSLVKARYRILENNVISFELGKYDPSALLVIDPVVVSGNWLPSGVVPNAVAAKLDPQGNFIITGDEGSKLGIMKLNPSGTAILYSTLVETNPASYFISVTALAIDSAGNAYVPRYPCDALITTY